jgi:hypothetical protein
MAMPQIGHHLTGSAHLGQVDVAQYAHLVATPTT